MHPRPTIGVALAFFALQVGSYQLLPPAGGNFQAHTLPFAEIALGLLLILGWQLRLWAPLSTLLVHGFFAAVDHAYAADMQINSLCYATPEPLTIAPAISADLL